MLSIILLPMLFSSWSIQQKGNESPPLYLVRIEDVTQQDIRGLVEMEIQMYAQLYNELGERYILAAIDDGQIEALNLIGQRFQVLDRLQDDDGYYLIYAEPEIRSQIEAAYPLLQLDGRYALAVMKPGEEKGLYEFDAMISPLSLRPLVIPVDPQHPEFENVVSPDPIIQRIVDQVDSERLHYSVGSLSGEWEVMVNDLPTSFYTRYTYAETPIKKATRYVFNLLSATGLPTGYETYHAFGAELRNVVAEQTGLTDPERIYLLIAHLDSTSPVPFSSAPGADDNASGSGTLIHAAEILSQYEFGCTLRYILFTGEEQGYLGSQDYAAEVRRDGENIEAVLNLDMLGYNTPGTAPVIELHTRPENEADLAIANIFADSITAYSVDLTPFILQDGKSFSDHSSFWDQGYPAIMAIEDWSDHTPNYHQTTDQLDSLNMEYYTEFSKASIAAFAEMGCLLQGDLQGIVTDADSGEPIRGAYVKAEQDNGWIWAAFTDNDGLFKLDLVPGSFSLEVSAPFYTSQAFGEITIDNEQTLDVEVELYESGLELIPVYLPLLHASSTYSW